MLSKSLLIIIVLAALLFHESEGGAQPLTSEKLGPEVRFPDSSDSIERPLLPKGVITEEDLQEDSPENRTRLSPFRSYVPTPVSPSFAVLPGEALMQKPVDEGEAPEEVQLGRENLPEEESRLPILNSKGPPVPTSRPTSLLAKITPHTAPRRAASLRLTDEGRKLLDSVDAAAELAAQVTEHPGARGQHRGVGVVSAGVHTTRHGRTKREAGVLGHRERIHIGPQQQRGSRCPALEGGD